MLNPLDDWTGGYTQPGPIKNALGSAPTGAQPSGGNSLEQAWAPMGGSGGTISPGPSASAKTAAAPPNPADAITRSLGVAPAQNWSLGDTPTMPTAPNYTSHVQAVTSGTPHAPDTLARQLATDFTKAGHKVTWGDDGSLVVDGRPYEVLGSGSYQTLQTTDPSAPPTNAGHGATPTPAPAPAAAGQSYDFGNPVYNAIGALFQKYGHTPTQSDVSQWGTNVDANYMTAIEAKIAHEFGPGGPQSGPNGTAPPNPNATHPGRWDDGYFRATFGTPNTMQELLALEPQIVREGGKLNKNAAGQYNGKITTPDGRIVDIMIAAGEGGKGYQWDEGLGGGGGGAAAPGARTAQSAGLAALWDQAGGLHDAAPYQPKPNPQLDAFIAQLLGHPESMDPHTVDTLKAADAEEQQQAADSADTSLKRFGFGSGLGDSNWLASERAATARSADQGIIAGRRNIDIKAAETNMADRRAAAGIGINKLQLDNTIKAQAAQLGLTREQLITQILQHIAGLEQNDQQFGADLGYRYDSLNSSNNNAYWNGTQ